MKRKETERRKMNARKNKRIFGSLDDFLAHEKISKDELDIKSLNQYYSGFMGDSQCMYFLKKDNVDIFKRYVSLAYDCTECGVVKGTPSRRNCGLEQEGQSVMHCTNHCYVCNGYLGNEIMEGKLNKNK